MLLIQWRKNEHILELHSDWLPFHIDPCLKKGFIGGLPADKLVCCGPNLQAILQRVPTEYQVCRVMGNVDFYQLNTNRRRCGYKDIDWAPVKDVTPNI